ncbi:hypothetical protein Sjap_019583 [Stephania japonica]|uniref:Uncharacterized protein n=1 Tax=Stephania japonica TaxID=461633 RepID=A0AAP0HZV2_9MAGN
MMAVSSSCKEGKGGAMDNGKYVRYTPEQVEALERLYHECPKPSSIRRQQLIRECPILSHIEPKQIKVWFQNRRCREKQRKEASRLQAVNRKLSAMNKLLMEENDRLQKQVSQLVYENGFFRQQTQTNGLATTDTSCESVVTSGQHHLTPQHPPRDASPAGLLSIAEETLTEFLSKATGTAVEWVQMPGMKPGPDSIGIVAISHGCTGVAARACGLVGLEPTRVAEILKDRPSWFRDCRAVDVLNVLPTGNGGTIELLYLQLYAPTTLAPARDFWLLRYTSVLEDGSLVVCERSLGSTQGGPSMPSVQHFVRSEMLPSGYLIRPCEGGGSILHIVDHMDLEALRHLRQIAQEVSQSNVTGWGRRPAALRALSQRLSRGFNEAVNGFTDEGWSLMDSDGMDDVTILVNASPGKLTGANFAFANGFPAMNNAVLCAKASMLLQYGSLQNEVFLGTCTTCITMCDVHVEGYPGIKNVPPAILLRFLREHRSEWADSNIDAYSVASVKAGPLGLPGTRVGGFGGQVILPLAHTIEHEEFLEVIKLENIGHCQDDGIVTRDMFLLQDASSPNRTLDLASALEVGPAGNRASGDYSNNGGNMRSVMTIAFQFAFENHLQDNVASMARQYVRSIISSVQRVALALSPSLLGSHAGLRPPLALLKPTLLHALPVFTFANQAGLDMLETTLVNLQEITLEKIFDDHGRKTLCSEFPQIMQQGFACLQGGICLSSMGRPVSYERAVAWKVLNEEDVAHCICFMFVNWSFV